MFIASVNDIAEGKAELYRLCCSKQTQTQNTFRKRNDILNEWETLENKNKIRTALHKENDI